MAITLEVHYILSATFGKVWLRAFIAVRLAFILAWIVSVLTEHWDEE
jgi:hypothetical protein